jgi:predicted enzyme involved in methoxymalonyl-ACP biosynthesis
MVRSQVVRETDRKSLSREEFLAGLELHATFVRISGRDDPKFPRTFELLNKTNQFNTTGRRWTEDALDTLCREGIALACEVCDKHANYGLVFVGLAADNVIEQAVMSCRIIGLDVEIAAISVLNEMLLPHSAVVTALTRVTDANLLSRDLFERCGWSLIDGVWQTRAVGPIPPHVTIMQPRTAMSAA